MFCPGFCVGLRAWPPWHKNIMFSGFLGVALAFVLFLEFFIFIILNLNINIIIHNWSDLTLWQKKNRFSWLLGLKR